MIQRSEQINRCFLRPKRKSDLGHHVAPSLVGKDAVGGVISVATSTLKNLILKALGKLMTLRNGMLLVTEKKTTPTITSHGPAAVVLLVLQTPVTLLGDEKQPATASDPQHGRRVKTRAAADDSRLGCMWNE